MAIKPPSNLHRSRSGILHFRIAIPIDVQYHFTNKEIYCSLRTANVREAACAAQALSITFKQTFSKLRNNTVPQEVWIDSAEHALALLARQHEASRFAVLIALTRQQQPQLLAWLAQRPLQALVLSAECSACSIARRPYCRAICRQTSHSDADSFAMLAKAAWLARCRLYYWGDIDTHGFAILDQLRGQFAQTSSLLMDRATLMAHAAYWGSEPQATSRDLARLNEAESALYDDLRDQRLVKNLRLEQERIGFQWRVTALAALP